MPQYFKHTLYFRYTACIDIHLIIRRITMKKPMLLVLTTGLVLTACQPQSQSTDTTISTNTIPLIQAQTTPVSLSKDQVCHLETPEESASCTKYHLQSIKTNVPWIDQYFHERLKQEHKEAFDPAPLPEVTLDPELPSTNYSTASVRYVSQHYQLATFEYFSDYFPAGAAHGMHHVDYVVFDLKQKQRLTLNDIVVPAQKEALKAELFDYNSEWLEQRHIALKDFELSNNFYFGASGLVFVYPVYELASYAEGISELKLPYWALKDKILAQYLPQLPESSEEIYQ